MSLRPFLHLALIALSGACLAEPEAPEEAPRKDRSPLLRFIIVSCPADEGSLQIMSKNDKGSTLDWDQVPGASYYNVIRGDLAALTVDASAIS